MLGDILRAEREKRGLTLKDIEQETSIRSVYIEAIEKGDFKALPGMVYGKGFVRNYAMLLGLDEVAMVQMFKEENAEHEAQAQTKEREVNERKADKRKPELVKREKSLFASGDDFHERVEKSHRTQNILVAVAVIVLAFVGSIFYFFGDDSEKAKVAEKPAGQTEQKQDKKQNAPAGPQANNQQAAQQGKQTAQTPAMQPQQTAGTGEISVAAQFTKRCWTQVIADGKTIYEGTIEPGQSFNWQGKNMVTVLAGNAGAVKIAYNGKDMGSLGKEGEVIEKRFTKDKVEVVK